MGVMKWVGNVLTVLVILCGFVVATAIVELLEGVLGLKWIIVIFFILGLVLAGMKQLTVRKGLKNMF